MLESAGSNTALSGIRLPRPTSIPREESEEAPEARSTARPVDRNEPPKPEALREPQTPIQPPRPSIPSQARRADGSPPFVLPEKLPTPAASRPAFSTLLSERIAQVAKQPPPSNGDRILIRLCPPHLGEIVIELKLAGGRLQGRIVAETEAARDAIDSQMQDLRQRLERRGIRVGEIEVAVEPASTLLLAAGPRSARRQLLDVVA